MNKTSRLPKHFEGFLKRRDEFNVLFPTERIFEIPEAFKLVPELVWINPNPAVGDIWEIGEREDENGEMQQMYALTNQALRKIAQAAEITFDPKNTNRSDDGTNPRRVEYQATGLLRKPDGQWISITQAKEIDLDVIESEYKTELEAEAAHEGLKVSKNGTECALMLGTPECSKEISRRLSAKMLMWRKNKMAFAITGAYKRVIRSLLLIKDYYTLSELNKPFVIPRVSLDTDVLLENIELRKKLEGASIEFSINLFGPPTEPPTTPRVIPPKLVAEISKKQKVRPSGDENKANGAPQTGGGQ